MPIYEYRCEKCGHQFERLQKISDEPLMRCPKCDQDSLKKLVSVTSFQLKGNGWYATDFKDKGKPKKEDKKDVDVKSPASSADDGKCSSCPAKKECKGDENSRI